MPLFLPLNLVGSYQIIGSYGFLRQEFDFCYAFPLGFFNVALNFGISSGVVFPWGNGFLNRPSYLPERFFLGGNSSPVCTLGGPTSILGFKSRVLGPAEPRRQVGENSNTETADASSEMDFLGGDLAFTAFADISFDIPLKVLRDAGMHGHAFACMGSLTSLTENSYREFSLKKVQESFRCSAGFGIIVPTKLFCMEVVSSAFRSSNDSFFFSFFDFKFLCFVFMLSYIRRWVSFEARCMLSLGFYFFVKFLRCFGADGDMKILGSKSVPCLNWEVVDQILAAYLNFKRKEIQFIKAVRRQNSYVPFGIFCLG